MNRLPSPPTRRVASRVRVAALLLGPLAAVHVQAADVETDRQYCERQQGVARTVCLRELEQAGNAASATPAPAAGKTPFRVVDGNHVDPTTFKGFQTWRAAACDRCHGANQQGLVGPSLLASLKSLSKDDFVKAVTQGRLDKGMPAFAANQTVMANLDPLYTYLKGRADGAITQSHVERIQ
jgi:mono/diheme cytochrome c family protein